MHTGIVPNLYILLLILMLVNAGKNTTFILIQRRHAPKDVSVKQLLSWRPFLFSAQLGFLQKPHQQKGILFIHYPLPNGGNKQNLRCPGNRTSETVFTEKCNITISCRQQLVSGNWGFYTCSRLRPDQVPYP